jgi:DnaJ-class molecular chaperone
MARCTRKSDWYADLNGKTCPTCRGTGHGTAKDPATGKDVDSGACPQCGGFGKVEK